MSLWYILDGYNIVHQMPGEMPGKLEDRRLKLTHYLETHTLQGSIRNEITVVFDGQFGMGSVMQSGTIRIVFSQDEKADELIKKMVESSDNPKNVVVVTDDRSIQYAVRALGAAVKTVDQFMQFKKEKKAPKKTAKSSANEPSKHISYTAEAKINAEFEQIWIKKKNK